MSNNVYYACLMAVADAERYQRLTYSDNLRAALDDLYKVLPEGFVGGLPYVTNEHQIKYKTSILQKETYKALTAYLPEQEEETIYNIITGATVYNESNDPDIKQLQKSLSEMRVAAGKTAINLNELKVASILHSKAAEEAEAAIKSATEAPSSPTVRKLSATHLRSLSALEVVNEGITNISKRLDSALSNIGDIEVQVLQVQSYKQLKELTTKTANSIKALDDMCPADYSGKRLTVSVADKERATLDGLTEVLLNEDSNANAYRELDNIMLDEHAKKIQGGN